ncbi:MAG TPA: hypothetical protein VLW84_04905 [Terriglobales bacterium]|nr:hypothetical protein [Terriglobales bacterium]
MRSAHSHTFIPAIIPQAPSMRIKRRLPVLLGVLLVAAAVAAVVVLRKHAPPEPARLLPGADGFFYLNFKWIRRANLVAKLPPVSHDPEYEQFIQATGFEFERDLDQAALAIHYPSATAAATKASVPAHFSEIFVGKLDGERLRAYLRNLSHSVENYHSIDIYTISLEGRTLRVAILGVDMVAASNQPDPQVIHGIIDRSRKLASPFGGPALLRQYYKEVPIASLGWAIFRLNPGGEPAPMQFGLSFLFSKPAVIVASARFLGKVHVRAEAFTADEADARQVAEKVTTFLNLFHTAENTASAQGPDPDVKAFFDGLKVEQHSDKVIVTSVVPPGFIRKAVAEPPEEPQSQVPAMPSSTSQAHKN